ncbi:MAG: aspartate aminotransferase family protein [Verrucomicrobia bacterium]|nr:aspartate aminotransferase family protein [Verrucomicrobiota bacterium]MBV9298555.1 aspartate aminotransferase family protein [Verrucomicrobiota bacterium]
MPTDEPDTRNLFEEFVVPTYSRYDVVLVRGRGSRVWDEEGKEYLDFGAGIAVSTLGHAHPRMIEALDRQARKLIHTSNLYYTRPQGELARKLVELVDVQGKVFFSNSGAEANEAAIKLARKFGNECSGPLKNGSPKFEILTFHRSFHGRTIAGISATAQEKIKEGFAPLLAGFKHLPFNELAAVEKAITGETVAILIEPVQGEGGIYPASNEFLLGLRRLCDHHGLLLMLDEIQCGLGRLGNWCGWKEIVKEELVPDTISWAKGIGGGFPLGATWIRKKPIHSFTGAAVDLCDLLKPGTHGTTYGGTPLACATSLAVLETIEQEGLLQHARNHGDYAKKQLSALPGIKEVRGIGLMLGIELGEEFAPLAVNGKTPSQVIVVRSMQNGLLTVPAGPSVIRWLPPLNVSRTDIDEAVSILARSLDEIRPR